MTTAKQDIGLSYNEPIRFLDSTVLSFNMSLGIGAQSESTLNIDLVNDCGIGVTRGTGFMPYEDFDRNLDSYGVGMPVYFPDNPQSLPGFWFGGILSSWTVQKSTAGWTYNAIIKDPRQLLENTLVIIDSVISGPVQHVNYFNVYAFWEQATVYDPNPSNCAGYGNSYTNDKGMPYYRIIQTLKLMQEADKFRIFPSTYNKFKYSFQIDFDTFPGIYGRTLPQWYRVPGPSISILQLLEDICNTLAYDFYVYLEWDNSRQEHTIRVGLIDLYYVPQSFNRIINVLEPISTDISYGQEFRNEKSKIVLLGQPVHYLAASDTNDFYFGEDLYPEIGSSIPEANYLPVVPYGYDDCGFWISKKIDNLNLSLAKPFPSNGPYTISELDIRSAMSSYELWSARAFDFNTPGTFNYWIRTMYPSGVYNSQTVVETFANIGTSLDNTRAVAKSITDGLNNPTSQIAYRNQPDVVEDLKKVHNFLNNLGSTYYGKQFITRLPYKVCKKYDSESNQVIYSDIPTNAGGWINMTDDYGVPVNVLQLQEPELTHFRTEDMRIKGFARFDLSFTPSITGEVMLNTVSGYTSHIGNQTDTTNPTRFTANTGVDISPNSTIYQRGKQAYTYEAGISQNAEPWLHQ